MPIKSDGKNIYAQSVYIIMKNIYIKFQDSTVLTILGATSSSNLCSDCWNVNPCISFEFCWSVAFPEESFSSSSFSLSSLN